jgi:FkbM family methyltransferase
MQKLLYLEGPRFIAERKLLRELVRPGMAVADIGANIGYYALMFQHWVGGRGTVLCFEPEPDNLEELRRNVDRNRLASVTVMPIALGAKDESVSIARGINASITAESTDRVTVPVRRLDSVPIGRLDFIKIDVEGYEAFVLAGATATLQRFRPDLFIEIHPGLMCAAEYGSLLGQLRDYDPQLEIYRVREPSRSLARLLCRYFQALRIERVRGVKEFLHAAPELRRTFWCVCRGSRRVGRRPRT